MSPSRNTITVQAPAKLNLGLHIVGKRPDGYHEIETVFQKISLCDTLRITIQGNTGISLSCTAPGIPSGPENLAYRAADLLLQRAECSCGVSIHLQKNIPSGAGLGGGSSDAAAVLRGLNDLLQSGLSPAHLVNMGLSLGADVPFFLTDCSTAYATGIGEKLRPLHCAVPLWFVIVYPGFSVSTAWAYRSVSKYTLLTNQTEKFNVSDSIADVETACTLLKNDFEKVVIPAHGEITTVKSALHTAGARGCLLSGSGSCVYGIFETQRDCNRAAGYMNTERYRVFTACTI